MGLEQTAPILAVRSVDSDDGQVLLLWIYLNQDEVEFEIDTGEDDTDTDFEGPEL